MPTSKPVPKLSYITVLLLSSLLLLFAPIVRGGKTSMAIMTMELLGSLILLVIFWSGMQKGCVAKPAKWFIIGSLSLISLYLIPLPLQLWEQIPGRTLYIETINWLETNYHLNTYKAYSLVPLHTASVLLSCIPALGLFLAATSLPTKYLIWLVNAFLLSAVLQASLGIIQHISQDPFYHFGVASLSPQGTYLNQNHLTAFMEIAEPLALALMIYFIVSPISNHWLKTGLALLFAGISLLLTYIPLITSSRMGAALLFLSIILSFWVMTTPGIRKKVMVPIIALRFILLGLAIYIQYKLIHQVTNVVTGEMRPQVVMGDLRWELWSRMFAVQDRWLPLGTGPGTFQQAFKTQQPHTLTQFINHIHNDYLQIIFEFGLAGIWDFYLAMEHYLENERWLAQIT